MYDKKLTAYKGRMMRMKKKMNRIKTKVFRNAGGRLALRLTGLLLVSAMLAGCGGSGKSVYTESYDAGGYAMDNAAVDTAAMTEEIALSGGSGDMSYYEEGFQEAEAAEPQSAPETGSEEKPSDGRKLIKTVDMHVETEQYDVLLVSLEAQIAELGGYVEYQYQYNGSSYSNYDETRNVYMSVRIPSKRLDEFVRKVGEQSNITNKEERVEDVTLQYVDLESRKKALVIEQDRLLELLEKAETVEDIITIEQRLSEVRYELENMESQLRTLNNRIDYSTINLDIQEVKRLTPTEEKSAWDRMKNGFVQSLYRIGEGFKNGFIGFVINIPYIVIWLFIIAVIFVIVRIILKKQERKKAEKEQQARQWQEAQRKQQEMLMREQREQQERFMRENGQQERFMRENGQQERIMREQNGLPGHMGQEKLRGEEQGTVSGRQPEDGKNK